MYGQPALGNPIFESQTHADWVAHLLAKVVADGGEFVRTTTGFKSLTDDDAEAAKSVKAHFRGEHAHDTMERRNALGLDPF